MEANDAVVVLIDGSEEAVRAAEYAAGLARRTGSRLIMVSPAYANPVPIGGGGRLPERVRAEVRQSARDAELEVADRRLHDVRERLELIGPVELRVAEVRSSLADPILDILHHEPCLTVAIPRRRHGLIMRMLGDHAAEIEKRSPAPVTLVP